MSTDAADLQRAFSKDLDTEFRYLPDTSRNLTVLFRAAKGAGDLALRKSILIDREGVVRWIDEDVSTAFHGPDVLAKMRQLGMAP